MEFCIPDPTENTQINKSVKEIKTNTPIGKVPLSDAEFETCFKHYFGPLHAYASTILKDPDAAEEVVQTVFLKLWEKRASLHITVSLKAYLYKSVYHRSLNTLKHEKVKAKHLETSLYEYNETITSQAFRNTPDQASELMHQVQKIVNRLPEKCRRVFQLSRFEELKYQEIADRLGISIKTVEAHMGKALKSLREGLTEFLPMLFLIVSVFNR